MEVVYFLAKVTGFVLKGGDFWDVAAALHINLDQDSIFRLDKWYPGPGGVFLKGQLQLPAL